MTKESAAANPRRRKAAPAADKTPPALTLVPSAPEPVALGRLRRAPENVRHTRVDEDVETLADDIAAHGILSSLIGYAASWPEDGDRIFVVGGGRRLQALELLRDRGLVDDAFTVPVLIRDAELAVELSLAENLQQRTMSPVDEFVAFRALMDTGRHSPAELAKRFGFSERTVKQRLRLAELAPPVIDALAAREISLDAAMAYATTQDQELQAKVFKQQAKSNWKAHEPEYVRRDIKGAAMSTADPVFRFVTPAIYEREGGEYEDDLFTDAGVDKVVRSPALVERKAKDMIDFQAIRLIEELKRDDAWSPTITGHVVIPGYRFYQYGTPGTEKAPSGWHLVSRYDAAAVWRTIRNNGIEARVLVGINPQGELIAWPGKIFVPLDQRDAVDPQQRVETYKQETPEERAARYRQEGITREARRIAVGPFAGTRFEGRAFWPDSWEASEREAVVDGKAGAFVFVKIFVSREEVEAHAGEAEAAYEARLAREKAEEEERTRAEAERAAEAEKRETELRGMDPPPNVAVIDGEAWARSDDGGYAPIGTEEDGYVEDWEQLLDHFSAADVETTYATRAEFDAAMAQAGATIVDGMLAEAAE